MAGTAVLTRESWAPALVEPAPAPMMQPVPAPVEPAPAPTEPLQALLASSPTPTCPDEVAARITTALAAEAAGGRQP